MPVQYHFPERTHSTPFRAFVADANFWVVESLILAAFLVLQFGFRIPEWSNGERVNGVIVDKWVSGKDEREFYTAAVREDETGRRFELDLHSGEEVGDRVEAVIFPGDYSKVIGPGELQTYVVAWLGTLLGLFVWPPLWFVARFSGRPDPRRSP
jgi:hypothetical protein